ncbi:MAG: DUF952 domain-containing protein [Deltaproteobacteria bacterium]|nr:DUF952 domain-containing protein [Deltaproteobacteria bacterium]
MIYKICSTEAWAACQKSGHLPWAEVDRRDGFVHLSARNQVEQTAAKHFAGQTGLMILEVDPDALPTDALRWEVSRGGDRFPHLYADLPLSAVSSARPAPLDADGIPQLWGATQTPAADLDAS